MLALGAADMFHCLSAGRGACVYVLCQTLMRPGVRRCVPVKTIVSTTEHATFSSHSAESFAGNDGIL